MTHPSSDALAAEERVVAYVAACIEVAELSWKAENGGDDASVTDCPDEIKARAAIQAYRKAMREGE